MLALGAVMLTAGPALAQSMDGTWQGRIRCEAAGTLRALNSPITVTIAGTRATYERNIVNPSDTSRSLGTESGNGTVAPDGTVRMTGSFGNAAARQESSFSGRLARPSSTLAGTITTFSRANASGIERRCTITIQPG